MPSSPAMLSVVLADKPIGILHQLPTGNRTFTYSDEWEDLSTPLSLSMPLRQASYRQKVVDPYLWGLIPDNHDVRRQIGRQFDVSPNNPIALLSKIGLDCAGAVRFCVPDQIAQVLSNKGELIALSEHEIAQRLRALKVGGVGIQLAEEESWSLAGNQAKMALRQVDGQWYQATGAQPTTHILKPGIALLDDQALNEYLCMKVAERIGLSASSVTYLEFEDEPALCVERYDRMYANDNRLIRVHQEDLCQALSVDPDNKYPTDGGPTADMVLDLLSQVGRPDMRDHNRKDFARALFFNYLLMAPDGHAKNYSLLLLADAVRLAPLYDIASGAPYTKNYGELKYRNAAMRIGGENHFGSLTLAHLRKFSKRNRFDDLWTLEQFRQMAVDIPGALEEVFDDTSRKANITSLRETMLAPLTSHCAKAVRVI